MLVEITKDSLMNAVQQVIKAVAVNSPIPILQGIYIQADEDGISFTASNKSMTIQYIVPQDGVTLIVKRTGAIVIPSRYFYDVIRKFSDEMVALKIKDHLLLTIVSGHSKIRLSGIDSTEFPYLYNEKELSPRKLLVNNALFRSIVKQVAIVASTSENRPVLTGIFFEYNNGSLNLMATDGVRLASGTLCIEGNANKSFNVIIPAKNLYEISKMLRDANETTEIEVGNNLVRFIANGLKVESALIQGTFPSVRNVIPKSYECEILIDRISLLKALECVTVIASQNIIRLEATASKLKLSSRTAEIGDIENEIPLLEMSGEQFIISLNGKFLIDIFRNSECVHARIRYTGKTNPIVVLPDDSHMSTLFLITPVRTHTHN